MPEDTITLRREEVRGAVQEVEDGRSCFLTYEKNKCGDIDTNILSPSFFACSVCSKLVLFANHGKEKSCQIP